jgi:molecular chaperone GrpE
MGENHQNESAKETATEPTATQTAQARSESETHKNEIEELKVQLETKDKQLKEYLDRLRRAQADFENYKKRIQKEQEQSTLLLEDRLINEFLPLYDNLERAFRSYNSNQDKDSFIEGVERIFAQFHSFIEARGVQTIQALGEVFDPALHDALITVESTESGGKVLEEFERGFIRYGRVIRPSKVKVSKKIQKPTSTIVTPDGSPKEE